MKLDDINTKAIIEVANRLMIPHDTVLKYLEAYYKGVRYTFEREPPGVIKMDLLGKFIFNHSAKEIVQQTLKNKNEVNGDRSRVGATNTNS